MFHHFGSITQKALKLESGQKELGDRHYFYRKLGFGWWARKRYKALERRRFAAWARDEAQRCGVTLHMTRRGGAWLHR